MKGSPAFMLLGTSDGPEVARRILAMPDAVILRDHLSLRAALRSHRAAGEYVAARVATLAARRDPDGRLPTALAINLIHARMALRAAARGEASSC